MDFDKILDDCLTLENTITTLVNQTAEKKSKLNWLHNAMLGDSTAYLGQLSEREHILQSEFECLRLKKEELECDIEKHTSINEQIREWVTLAQKNSDERKESHDKSNEILAQTAETIYTCDQVKSDYFSVSNEITFLGENLEKQTDEVKKLVRDGKEIVVNLHKNNSIIRILQQQNKYSEQQFDLILNLLPYEPLTKDNIEEIREHKEESIRNLADVLEMQANEIKEFNECLNLKRAKKLDILEQLAHQLNTFIRKRDEAIMLNFQR